MSCVDEIIVLKLFITAKDTTMLILANDSSEEINRCRDFIHASDHANKAYIVANSMQQTRWY
jgi:hypothetical protein